MSYETWRRTMSAWARSRGQNVALFDTVGSTNRVGTQLLSRATRPRAGCWIFALHQREGAGRDGRRWASPYGSGVYASRLIGAPRTLVVMLPQLIGVALCEGLRTLGFECRLKWPNDVLLGGKKVGGILLRSRGTGERVGVIAGFGINHSHRPEDLPREDSTSLRLAGSPASLSLARLTCALAERVDDELAALLNSRAGSPAAIIERYRSWSAHRLGDHLAVSFGEGVYEGEFAGFAANGALRLRTGSTERLLSAGEVEP